MKRRALERRESSKGKNGKEKDRESNTKNPNAEESNNCEGMEEESNTKNNTLKCKSKEWVVRKYGS